MLDAFIIERIKREQQEREKSQREPLHIPRSRFPDRPRSEQTRPQREEAPRGVVIIDF